MRPNGHDEPPVLVALVPITVQADAIETFEHLPEPTFAAAKVRTKIIRICLDHVGVPLTIPPDSHEGVAVGGVTA